jgi:hypothetical protein
MIRQRKAYFRTHPNSRDRVAFVRRQQARLRVLKRAAACTVPRSVADLAVGIVAAPEPVIFGGQLTYTITVQSTGNSRVVPVVTVVLPAAAFVSATAAQGSCSKGVDLICELDNVDPGANTTVTVIVRPTQVGALTLTARVTTLADVDDPDAANNTASQSTNVVLPSRSLSDLPDDTAAPQIHIVYVVPRDGVDRQLDQNGTLATPSLRSSAGSAARPAGE